MTFFFEMVPFVQHGFILHYTLFLPPIVVFGCNRNQIGCMKFIGNPLISMSVVGNQKTRQKTRKKRTLYICDYEWLTPLIEINRCPKPDIIGFHKSPQCLVLLIQYPLNLILINSKTFCDLQEKMMCNFESTCMVWATNFRFPLPHVIWFIYIIYNDQVQVLARLMSAQ